MRALFAVVALSMILAGCLDLPESTVARADPVDALAVSAGIGPWLAASTSTDSDVGIHWDPEQGNWTYSNGTLAGHPFDRPRYVEDTPFLLGMEALQGMTDWEALHDLLSLEGAGHYEYHDLLYRSITGKYFPEHFDDGAVDGLAPFWILEFAVEWAPDHQDEWTARWDGGLRWAGGMFSGTPFGACKDRAPEVAWVGSGEAFEAAMGDADFAAVTAAGGTVWLRLMVQDAPDYDLDAGLICPDEADLTWRVQAMDLDGLLDGAGASAAVWVDAVDGSRGRSHVTTLRHPGTYTWTTAFTATDSLVASPESPWTFDVPPSQVRLWFTVTALPGAGVGLGESGSYTLTAPTGTTYVVEEFAGRWTEGIADPEPGTWTLSRTLASPSTTEAVRSITVETLS